MISGLQPPTTAALVANDGARYPAAGITLVSGPHVLYNPPPSIGIGSVASAFQDAAAGLVRGWVSACRSVGQRLPRSATNTWHRP